MKAIYEAPCLEIIAFESKDIITTSTPRFEGEDDEL